MLNSSYLLVIIKLATTVYIKVMTNIFDVKIFKFRCDNTYPYSKLECGGRSIANREPTSTIPEESVSK